MGVALCLGTRTPGCWPGRCPPPATQGDSTLVLGHMAFRQRGGACGTCLSLTLPPATQHLCAWLRTSLRAGILLFLSVAIAGAWHERLSTG